MIRDELTIYRANAHSWWQQPQKFQRLLMNMVRPRLAYFDRFVDRWQGVQVLDLGCGGGYMSEALARRGACVTGIDPSAAGVAAAWQHALSQDLAIHYGCAVGEALPFADHSFDRVVCVDVLEHVQDMPQVLTEIQRVLRPGGMLFFDTVNRNWLARLLLVTGVEDVLRWFPRGSHDPQKFIRPAEMQRYLEKSGFQINPAEWTGLGPVGINRHLDFTFNLLPVTWLVYLGYAVV